MIRRSWPIVTPECVWGERGGRLRKSVLTFGVGRRGEKVSVSVMCQVVCCGQEKRREGEGRGGDRKVHVYVNVRRLGRRGREREKEIGGRGGRGGVC